MGLALDPRQIDALDAVARGLARQADAHAAAVLLGEGGKIRAFATSPGPWPADGDIAADVEVDGTVVGSVRVLAPRVAAEPALADTAVLVASLLRSWQRERQLVATLERERTAAEAGSDWLWETDVDGKVTWVSESVERHTGWPASWEIGQMASNFVRPPAGEEELKSWERYLADRAHRRPFRDAICERDTAHGPMLAAMSGQPRFDHAGRFVGYRGAACDVTSKLAGLMQARRSERLLLQALEGVQAGIMITGPDGHVLLGNDAWQRHQAPMQQGTADATPRELQVNGQDLLVTDQLLADGSVIHLSLNITDLRRAEREVDRQRAEVLASKARMEAVLRAVPDLWIVFDADDRYMLCSDDAHPWLVQPFEQMRGRTMKETLLPELAAASTAAMNRARATGSVVRIEYPLLTSDGVQRIFEARMSPMPQGLLLLLTRDLTDTRRLEKELLLMQRAVESDAAVAIAVTDAVSADQPLMYVNRAFELLTGYSRSEALGRNCRFLQGDQRDQTAIATLRKAVAAGEACTVTLNNRRRDGSWFVNELNIAPVRDAQGALIQYLGVLKDVTARADAERALAAAEARWKFALEGAGDGVWDHDEEAQTAYYSQRWKQMLGYSEPEIGTSMSEWSSRLHPDDRARVVEAIQAYRQGTSGSYRSEYRLRHKDGHWVWVLDRGKIVEHRADGRPRRTVGTLTDITRLKVAEQALRDKQAAELANRAKSEFLSRMSHEMRTPLNAVIGFAQLLRLQPDSTPERVAEYTDHVLRAAEHLLALVNEVLDLQRVEEGKVSLQLQAIELAPFVDATLDLLRPMALAPSVALVSHVPAGVWVQADARCLRQVLINLFSNAIKYNRSAGWVSVSLLEAPSGRVVLGIEDTGSGLTDQEITRLFQPFERLGHETSGIEGSGLGLVIARSLVEQMGGELTLSSVKDAGTLARVTLRAEAPGKPAGPPAQAAPAPVAPATPLASLRMLYVEDNRINALLFEEAMRMLGGVELRIAEDGAQALEIAQGWLPQVLVIDANLPDMSGFEVLRRVRELPSLGQVPAYMCSADAMPEDLERARAAGFIGYWTKPIELAMLSSDLDTLREKLVR